MNFQSYVLGVRYEINASTHQLHTKPTDFVSNPFFWSICKLLGLDCVSHKAHLTLDNRFHFLFFCFPQSLYKLHSL
jgi:hypothetical protein